MWIYGRQSRKRQSCRSGLNHHRKSAPTQSGAPKKQGNTLLFWFFCAQKCACPYPRFQPFFTIAGIWANDRLHLCPPGCRLNGIFACSCIFSIGEISENDILPHFFLCKWDKIPYFYLNLLIFCYCYDIIIIDISIITIAFILQNPACGKYSL